MHAEAPSQTADSAALVENQKALTRPLSEVGQILAQAAKNARRAPVLRVRFCSNRKALNEIQLHPCTLLNRWLFSKHDILQPFNLNPIRPA